MADAGTDNALLARVHVFRALKAYYDADPVAMVRGWTTPVGRRGVRTSGARSGDILRGSVEVRLSGRSADERSSRPARGRSGCR
jgi:hypothetical protein